MDIHRKLRELVNKGDSTQVTRILTEHEVDVNARSPVDGSTLLVQCVQAARPLTLSPATAPGDTGPGDHMATCRTLAFHGADLNLLDMLGKSALHWAVVYRDSGMVTQLLDLGADPRVPDRDGHPALHVAIKENTIDCAIVLVKLGSSELLELADEKGVPPLIHATQFGNADACQLLIEEKVDVNVQEHKPPYRTALHYAISAGLKNIYQLLLRHGASASVRDSHGRCVIHTAAACKQIYYFRLIQKYRGPSEPGLMDTQNEDGATPLMLACQQGNIEHVANLLSQKVDVDITDYSGKTALHYCSENKDTTCSQLLLAVEKTLLNIKDNEGYSPLQLAVISGNIPMLEFLLLQGADINSTDKEGHTALHWATVCGHLDVIDFLHKEGANFACQDIHKAYPLHYAAQMCGNKDEGADAKLGLAVLHKLIKLGVPVDCEDQDARQPLLWAASSGSADACQILVAAGAKVEAADKDGLTALHCAASRGHSNCMTTLIQDCGAIVDSKDRTAGCTPLFYAITLGHIDCVSVLLERGADASYQDKKGRSPAHCAAAKGSKESLHLLVEKGGNLWLRNVKGEFPINEAALAGQNDTVDHLLNITSEDDRVNVSNLDGRTCLHVASMTNNIELVKILLRNKANINGIMKTKDHREYTVLDLAKLKNHQEIADYLAEHGAVPIEKAKEIRAQEEEKAKEEARKQKEREEQEIREQRERRKWEKREKKSPRDGKGDKQRGRDGKKKKDGKTKRGQSGKKDRSRSKEKKEEAKKPAKETEKEKEITAEVKDQVDNVGKDNDKNTDDSRVKNELVNGLAEESDKATDTEQKADDQTPAEQPKEEMPKSVKPDEETGAQKINTDSDSPATEKGDSAAAKENAQPQNTDSSKQQEENAKSPSKDPQPKTSPPPAKTKSQTQDTPAKQQKKTATSPPRQNDVSGKQSRTTTKDTSKTSPVRNAKQSQSPLRQSVTSPRATRRDQARRDSYSKQTAANKRVESPPQRRKDSPNRTQQNMSQTNRGRSTSLLPRTVAVNGMVRHPTSKRFSSEDVLSKGKLPNGDARRPVENGHSETDMSSYTSYTATDSSFDRSSYDNSRLGDSSDSQRNKKFITSSVQESVRKFEQKRYAVRELNRLKRLQLHNAHLSEEIILKKIMSKQELQAPTQLVKRKDTYQDLADWEKYLFEEYQSSMKPLQEMKIPREVDERKNFDTPRSLYVSPPRLHTSPRAGQQLQGSSSNRSVTSSIRSNRSRERSKSPLRPEDHASAKKWRELQEQKAREQQEKLAKIYTYNLPIDLFDPYNRPISRRKPTRNNPPSTSGRSVSAQDNGPRRPKSRSSSPPSSKSSSSSFPRLSSEPNVARPETSQTTRSSTTYSNSQSSRGQNRKQGVSQAQFNSKLPAIYRKYGTLKPLKDDQIKSKFSPSKPQLEKSKIDIYDPWGWKQKTGFWAPKDESVHPPPPLKPAVPDEQYHEEPVDIPVEMARERQKRLRMLKTVYNRPVIPSIEINSVLDPVWRK